MERKREEPDTETNECTESQSSEPDGENRKGGGEKQREKEREKKRMASALNMIAWHGIKQKRSV